MAEYSVQPHLMIRAPFELHPKCWTHLTFEVQLMKYSLQDKLNAVRYYLAGLGSQRQTARKFSVAHVQLRRWIAAYQHHGKSGLQPGRRRRYTPAFKLAAVEFARSNPLSLADVAARFDIPSYTTLEHWVKLYQENGAEALNLDKRGHRMSRHPKTPMPINRPMN